MLATFFINANKEHTLSYGDMVYRKKGTNKGGTEWRIKHHAEDKFFEWLASWAITMTKPSDLGYDNDGFILPELRLHPVFVKGEYKGDQLLFTNLHGISDRVKTRQSTLPQRLEALKSCMNGNGSQWIIWAGLDSESKGASNLFDGAVEVKGSDTIEYKVKTFEEFQDGKFNILVTKCKIGGFGMNFQNAHSMVFLGLNDSWETFYQAVRRQWRYGQTQPVDVYIIMSDIEAEIFHNVMRKDAMAKRLRAKLIEKINALNEQTSGLVGDELIRRLEELKKDIDGQQIQWVGEISFQEKVKLYMNAKAFVFPQEEDFGIAAVESQAAGTPVIAYKKGGSLDTVIDGKTGVFFEKQNKESLIKAVKRF